MPHPQPIGPQPDDRPVITADAYAALLTVHGETRMRAEFKTVPDHWDFTRDECAMLGINYHSSAYWERRHAISYTRTGTP